MGAGIVLALYLLSDFEEQGLLRRSTPRMTQRIVIASVEKQSLHKGRVVFPQIL
jgi:hypothetical protein